MLPSLDGIRLKLQRADQQLKTLKGEIAVFLDGDPYEPAVQFRRIRGAREARCVMDFTIRMIVKKPCDPMWSIIIGEIVHDLRSALDHSVYQLVIHATDKPPAEDVRTQFPIFLDPSKFKKHGLDMLAGVNRKAVGLIETLQPFSTGERDRSPLWHLNKLSNIDKHRTLHLTGGTVESFNFSFPPIVNAGRIDKRISEQGAFEHNTIVVEGRMFSDQPMLGTGEVKVKAEIAFDIVFDQRTPLVGEWSVLRTLLDAANRTRESIKRIGDEILSLPLAIPEFKI